MFKPPFNPITNAPYTADEQIRLRAEFALVAARFRRQKRLVFWCVGGLIGAMLLSSVVPERFSEALGPLLAIGGMVTMGVLVVSAVRMANMLVCPGCLQNMEKIGEYCPECGSAGLEPGGWFSSPHCSACGKKMRRGKGRHYTIRACSHCGLYLDEQGL
ncbi:hypothetical protein GCM10027044_28000 [Hymenobacter ruber]